MTLGRRAFTYFEGQWAEGNTPIIGAADHAAWHGTQVFDGARWFDGLIPDLEHHCARLVRSARSMSLEPTHDGPEIAALIREGIAAMKPGHPLYVRPMMWSRVCGPGILDAEPDSTAFTICLEEYPMPDPAEMTLTVSPYRRPRQDTALTEAKAACLYPNNARIILEARKRGFKNALSLDLEGHVAETASTNVFLVADGVVRTPVPNGTFLNGITRQRSIALMRADGIAVEEASLTVADFEAADEIFLTGNASKVVPVTRFEDRELPTKLGWRVRELYMDYANSDQEMPL